MTSITRHFVRTGSGRHVHYRRAGSGPPLILLHASPCSSRVQIPLLEAWSGDFTVIALDTPGFGLSDPLRGEQPTIEGLAEALAETLGALGLERALFYGRHTGASIAVEFARRYPQRAAFVLTDGYTIVPKTPSDDYLAAYLPPIVPRWDGGHLLWLWYRYREQFIFWPWNNAETGTRADTDLPSLDDLQRGVVDLLEAGNGYARVYAAALRYRWDAPLKHLASDVCFGVRPGDSQYRYADYLRSAGIRVEVVPRDAGEAAARELQILRARRETLPSPPLPAADSGASLQYVDVSGRQILVRRVGSGSGLPLLMLPPTPGGSSQLSGLMNELGAGRPVISIDLPGNGYSDAPEAPLSVADWAYASLAVLDRLNIPSALVYGRHGGASVATELAIAAPDRIARLVLDGPICLDAAERDRFGKAYDADLSPRRDGGHLVALWHLLRDQRLWWPWQDGTFGAIRPDRPDISPETIHDEARAMVINMARFGATWRAVLDYDLAARLSRVTQPVMIGAAPGDVFRPCATAAMKTRSDAVRGNFGGGETHASINAFLRGL